MKTHFPQWVNAVLQGIFFIIVIGGFLAYLLFEFWYDWWLDFERKRLPKSRPIPRNLIQLAGRPKYIHPCTRNTHVNLT